MKNLRSRVLRKLLKTIQSEEKSFLVHRSFQTEERSKTQENTSEGLPWAPLRPKAGKNRFLLFFQVGSEDKALFYSLNP
jgi:hypothetical protein